MSPKLPVHAVAVAKMDANRTQSPKEHLTHPLKPRHFPPSIKETAVPTDKMLILDWQRKLFVMGILQESQAKGVSAEHTPAGGAPIWASEGGATANEYRLIAALIAPACIVTFKSLRLNLAETF